MMRKTSLLVAAFAAAAGFAIAAPAHAEGAEVVRTDGGCVLSGFGFFECTIQRVITPSGEVNVWIKGEVADPPAQTTHVDNASTGQFCTIEAPSFTGVVSKSGNVNLQCRN